MELALGQGETNQKDALKKVKKKKEFMTKMALEKNLIFITHTHKHT